MRIFIKKLRRGIALTLIFSPVIAWTAELTNADAVLNFAMAQEASFDSFTASLDEAVNLPTRQMQLTGAIAFKRPGRMRMEVTSPGQHSLMVVGLDRILWQEIAGGGQVRVLKLDWQNVPTNFPTAAKLKESFSRLNPQTQLAKAREKYIFKLLPATQLDGQWMYVLLGEQRPEVRLDRQQGPVSVHTGKFFIGQQDGFMYRIEEYADVSSAAVLSVKFSNLKLNPALADDLFVYRPALDANVVDLSQMLRKIMNRPATLDH